MEREADAYAEGEAAYTEGEADAYTERRLTRRERRMPTRTERRFSGCLHGGRGGPRGGRGGCLHGGRREGRAVLRGFTTTDTITGNRLIDKTKTSATARGRAVSVVRRAGRRVGRASERTDRSIGRRAHRPIV